MWSATIHIPPPSPEPVFRLSVEQYHAMIDAGVLNDDDPVELLEGVLVFKMPKKPKHRIALAKLQRALTSLIPSTMSLQLQEPITLSDGEPEPDAAIFRGRAEDYTDSHPGPADVHLVIEVSDTTQSRDRGIKLRSYARAGIPEYWIVDLAARAVEVYTDPDSQSPQPTYRQQRKYDERSTLPVAIGGEKLGQIPVSAILPG